MRNHNLCFITSGLDGNQEGQPKMVWAILDQITPVFGTLVDVDWQFNFNNFFEVVRVKLSCRDASKIPKDRTFGINGKFYKLLFA